MTHHPKNLDRASWAHAALKTFANETGLDMRLDEEVEYAVSDLLADIMHWCLINGKDFDALLADGRSNYEFELKDPEG